MTRLLSLASEIDWSYRNIVRTLARWCSLSGVDLDLMQRRPQFGVSDLQSEGHIPLGSHLNRVDIDHLHWNLQLN